MSTSARSRGSRVERPRTDRYAAMDGYRGLFVLLVIAYHFGATGLVGGWVGINHFFVFSGFLIARILIKERQRTCRIDVRRFYLRRARRVLPAMFVLVAAVLTHTAFFEQPAQQKQFGGDALATLGFYLNWRLIGRSDSYFDQIGNPSPLRHAWTLSVEEQFYVVIPFLILAICALTRSRRLRFTLVMALACLSAWWTAHLGLASFEDQARLYYGTDTRVQALLVGVAFGFAFGVGADGRGPRLPSREVTQILGILGTIVSISAVFLLDAQTEWVYAKGGVLLFALGASLMGWSSIDPRGLAINRVFGWRPLAFVGQISYGLYLYHWPVHLWLRPDVPQPALGFLQFVVTFALAVVSFRSLEAPILQDGLRGMWPHLRRSRRRALAIGASGVLAVASAAQARTSAPGVPTDVPPLVAGTPAYRTGAHQDAGIVGDSVGSSLAQGFSPSVYTDLSMNDATMIGCDLVPAPISHDGQDVAESTRCASWRAGVEKQLRDAHARTLVIVGDAHFLTTHRLDGVLAAPQTPQGAKSIELALDSWAQRARAAGVERTVVVNLPCRRIDPVRLDPSLRFFAEQGSNDAAVDWANGVIAAWVKHHPDAALADLHAQTCSAGYRSVINGVSLYEDTLHFTPRGAAMIWTWLAPQVQRAGAAR